MGLAACLDVAVQHDVALVARQSVQVHEAARGVAHAAQPRAPAERRRRRRPAEQPQPVQPLGRASQPVVEVAAAAQRRHEAQAALVEAAADDGEQVLVTALGERRQLGVQLLLARAADRAQPLDRHLARARQRRQRRRLEDDAEGALADAPRGREGVGGRRELGQPQLRRRFCLRRQRQIVTVTP